MNRKEKILVAIDGGLTSSEVLKYVGRMISGKKGLEVCVLHLLPPLPPQLREFRGSEDPEKEQELDREVGARGRRWAQEADIAAQAVLEEAASVLKRAGVSSNSVQRIVRQLVNHEDLSEDILETAQTNGCHTIVVGRSSFPWLKDIFHHHVADEIVKRAKAMTIWVVEEQAPAS